MAEAAETCAVQIHAFPCPASGGETSVLAAGMRIKETWRRNLYSRLCPREVGERVAHAWQTLSAEYRLHAYPFNNCYRWGFLPSGGLVFWVISR